MSVIGFDIGNDNCVIAAVKRGGIDVLLNHESKRETPAVVSFGRNQRFFGGSAADSKSITISQIKRLIGKLHTHYLQEKEEELVTSFPFVTREGPRGGGVLIELDYLKRKWTFTPVEILGMLFKHLKQSAEKNLESSVVDCVIGIPAYFTDLQRRLYLDAARNIAGLKPLRLMHEGTAIALGYGMYKTNFSNDVDSGPTVVVFVDIGHCDTQVTIAAFERRKMSILSHSFDQNLGGRDFDQVLYKHFAAQFNQKYRIDVCTNARASVRLRATCEKVKKVLSANAEAPLCIECLIGDTDVRGVITREEFENLSSKLLERLTLPCIESLKDCGLSVDQIHTVELVGSGSRIPAITRVLTLFFQKEPKRTLNASECVARGCALRCAMLSPTLQVRDYEVEDSCPYSIVLPPLNHDKSVVVFSKGNPFPNEKMLAYAGNLPFYFQVAYSNSETEFPEGVPPIVGHFRIGRSESSDEENTEVEFEVLLNDNGIVEIGYARMLEHKSFLWKLICQRRKLSLPFSGNLDVSTTDQELHESQKKEKILTEQDFKVEQTKEQRNTLESFVYDTRSKLSGAYKSFATDSEEEVIINSLKETEDWLYEDSDDESEQDFTRKLRDLKKLLEPIELKYQENARAKAEKALKDCIAHYRLHADSLSASEKQMVKSECIKVEKWLNRLYQDHLSPETLLTYINKAIEVFESNCKQIMRSKPSCYDKERRDQHEKHVDSDQRNQQDQREQQHVEPCGPREQR